MANYKAAYLAHMDSEGIKYTETGDFSVKVTYTGENLKSITISVFFDKDGENLVHFANWDIVNFSDDKYAPALIVCNEMNAKWKWVKFYLDKDKDICVDMDAYVDMASVGPECASMVRRMVNIIDQSYVDFMKVKFL